MTALKKGVIFIFITFAGFGFVFDYWVCY